MLAQRDTLHEWAVQPESQFLINVDGIDVVLGHVEHHIKVHRKQIGANSAGTTGRVALSTIFSISAHVANGCHPQVAGQNVGTCCRQQSPQLLCPIKDSLSQLKRGERISLRTLI